MHHHDRRRHGGGTSDRRRPPGRPGGAVAPGDPPRERGGRRGGRLVSAVPAAERTLAPLGRRRVPVVARREYGAYVVLSVADPAGPAPDPGQFAMLAAVARWGGGADERPFLPRAFSVARHHETGRWTSCSRTSAPARSGSPSWTPATSSGCSARWGAASPRRARRGGRSWSAAAWGSRRSRSGRTGSARVRSCCSGSATRRTPRALRCSGTRGSRPTTGRAATTGW